MNFRRRYIWALPGLAFKRWIIVLTLGVTITVFGLAIWSNLQPVTWLIETLKYLARTWPNQISGPTVLIIGLLLMAWGLRRMSRAMQNVTGDTAWWQSTVESLYRRYKLDRGPKIVAIGGGTGLSTLLRGIKHYSNNITAVVTVGDDGGSSGRLRQEQGIIPPGDIRNCIAALSDEESLITELFQYRFKQGEGLVGHSFGNLFLAAMSSITGDMMNAIKESSRVLNIRGNVLPSTLEQVHLVAEMENGEIIRGESKIPEAKQRISNIGCQPSNAQALPEVLDAIADAELIILGPGSLYTSVIPNLLLEEVASAVSTSPVPKLYVCNMVTQPGETDDYSVADHVEAILKHVHHKPVINTVMVHSSDIPEALLKKYEDVGSTAVPLDEERLTALGISVTKKPLLNRRELSTIRHDSMKLGRSIMVWFKRYQLDNR